MAPFWESGCKCHAVWLGDCLEVLRGMPDNSVDSCVTDPPYELGFMGKKWDASGIAYSVEVWSEVLRVLKPGGHLLAFGGTRTHHRMVCAIEDAGFEIRDEIQWLYGSGFPKSLDIGKAIPEWDGWGTALKPACEPICVARKPLIGTVAANVLACGTGGINVDGCRVNGEPWQAHDATGLAKKKFFTNGEAPVIHKEPHQLGRWPANVLLTHAPGCECVGTKRVKGGNDPRGKDGAIYAGIWSDGERPRVKTDAAGYADADGLETVEAWNCVDGCPVKLLDEQSAGCRSSGIYTPANHKDTGNGFIGKANSPERHRMYEDIGGASRFFYVAKASKDERGDGNNHPTVKPLDLIRYLVRLVTSPGGIVLDPFLGSGTAGKAAALESCRSIGIERDPEYVKIAVARIKATLAAPSLFDAAMLDGSGPLGDDPIGALNDQ